MAVPGIRLAAAPVDEALLEKTLDSIGTILVGDRTLDLLGGHRAFISSIVRDFAAQKHKVFRGLGHLAKKRNEFVLDYAHPAFWKDSSTADWKLTATGLGTFDNVVTESASQALRLDDQPDHWAYILGFLEIGSANNMVRAFFNDINADRYARVTIWPQSRLSSFKAYQLPMGILLKERGTIDIDIEFEVAADTEVALNAVHILPQEIAAAEDLSAYVTGVSI